MANSQEDRALFRQSVRRDAHTIRGSDQDISGFILTLATFLVVMGGGTIGVPILISQHKENKEQAFINTVAESIAHRNIHVQLETKVDGKERIVALQNPSAEDREFVNGFRAGTAGGLNNSVKICISDANGVSFCTIQIEPEALSKLISTTEADRAMVQSAESIGDLARICGVSEKEITVEYAPHAKNLPHALLYKLENGISHDPRYAEGYAKHMAEEKANDSEIGKA